MKVSSKQIGNYEYAIFIDRLKIFESKNQIYGTQSGMDNLFYTPLKKRQNLILKESQQA